MATKLYPIGMQTFSEIREEDFLYVDKTEYIYRMTHTSGKYFFLSRPRRFGKSLLVSTMQSYFEGKKELFKGLAIEKLEKDWTEYPVLHFSLAGGKHMEKDQLVRYLLYILNVNEEKFGIVNDSPDPNVRMLNLIKTVYEQTGQKVVVLIDEYDAPLLDVVHEDTSLGILREVMRNFYSPLKDSDRMLRFVFLTGITKFSQLSIFSELNNITNVSMDTEYAGICGITKEELVTEMHEDIQQMADVLYFATEVKTKKDLDALKEELKDTGIERIGGRKQKPVNRKRKNEPLLTTLTIDGFRVLMGKNNTQNEFLTLKKAAKTDLWLHARQIPGSHVVIETEGLTVPLATIEKAAALAAWNSKGKDSGKVDVDYTLIRYVKKIPNGPPGLVNYTHQKTIAAIPTEIKDE